ICVATFLLAVAAGTRAEAKKFTLPELIQAAHTNNPSLAANHAATSAVEAQISEAKRNWLPQGDLLSLLAPSPNVTCLGPPDVNGVQHPDTQQCISTTSSEVSLRNISWTKVFTRTEVRLIQPIWDFGKISAGVAAGEAGVQALQEKQASTRAEIDM